MDTKAWICRSSITLVLLLLVTYTLSDAAGQAELKLVKEEQIDAAQGPVAELRFLGKPEHVGAGQARFASVLRTDAKNQQAMIWAEGVSAPVPSGSIFYSLEQGILAQTQEEYSPEAEAGQEMPKTVFTVQRLDGRVLWQVKHTALDAVHVSGMGSVMMVRQDMANAIRGTFGVYVYDLHNGQLLTAFEDRDMLIGAYAFSGDGNRLVFEYRMRKSAPTAEDFLDPKVHLACMNADGKLLWDTEMGMGTVHSLSVSYDGHRVLYRGGLPNSLLAEKLGKKLHRKTGLVDGSGQILWEVDNDAGLNIYLLPDGGYYRQALYSDQSMMWDPTTKESPLRYCLFEALTHKNIWRKDLDELVPQLNDGWSKTAAGAVSLDGQWYISAFRKKEKQKNKPVQSLLVLSNPASGETIHEQELTGKIIKVLASDDSKVVEVLFEDNRRMLFERVP